MKDIRSIIKSPVITEKSTLEKDARSTYVFEVSPDANKKEIKQAVEKLFSVKVLDVRTVKIEGKVKRTKYVLGRRNKRKKAYVTINEKQKIDLFEGA